MIPSLLRAVNRLALASKNSLPIIRSATPSLCARARQLCSQSPPTESETNKSVKYVTLTEDVIKELAGGNEELTKRLKVIEFEYEVSKQEGARSPSQLTIDQWKELLSLESRSARKKYLSFLFKVEMMRLNEKQKKEERRLQRETEKQQKPDPANIEGHLEYGVGKNTISLRVYDTKIDQYHNYKIIRASLFENPLVYDLGYDENMTVQEQKNAAKQLVYAYVQNREHDHPFPMQFCNVKFDGGVIKHLHQNIPSLYQPEFPISLSPKSYLDLFPREKLVYLTPHCRNDLEEYDPENIYIVGCIVDKRVNEPLSLAKAKRENIKMARLPLDRYLSFGGGSGKSLTLNAMMSIMLEIKTHGNWELALRHVPRRKLKQPNEIEPYIKVNLKWVDRVLLCLYIFHRVARRSPRSPNGRLTMAITTCCLQTSQTRESPKLLTNRMRRHRRKRISHCCKLKQAFCIKK